MLSMCNQWFLCRWFQIMQQRCASVNMQGVWFPRFLAPPSSREEEVKKWTHSVMSDSVTPWTVAHQAPPSMEFSRQAYWSGLPFPSPGDLPDPGTETRSPTLQADTLPSEPPGKPVQSLSRVQLFIAPWTIAYQAPLSMRFSRQEYWSGLPLPSLADLPNPGIEPRSPTLQADTLPSEPPGKPHTLSKNKIIFLFL